MRRFIDYLATFASSEKRWCVRGDLGDFRLGFFGVPA